MAYISVTDTGIGISADDLDKLLIPFTQLDSFCARQYEGTGLGLALAKELAELHGGTIYVESEAGKGSTFTLALPIRDDNASSLATGKNVKVHQQSNLFCSKA